MQEEEVVYIPFLDTFYSLSSNEESERSFAASSLMHHLFLASERLSNLSEDEAKESYDALVKDGCYAMNRLLKGLCSGRASARQGYASCFSSFLKLSFNLSPPPALLQNESECWIYHFIEHMDAPNGKKASPIEFVREKLLECTHSQNVSDERKGFKKGRKGSEERDFMFGKLFGVLAVVRSGTLVADIKSCNYETVKGYVSDLLDLFHSKKWMRESAVHGLKELLNHINMEDKDFFVGLIKNSGLSEFLKQDGDMNVEKLALVLHLQTLCHESKTLMPTVLSSSILTVSSLEGKKGKFSIGQLLKETSNVVHPRRHIIWESIWSFLCEMRSPNFSDPTIGSAQKKRFKCLRESSIIGNDAPREILLSLVNNVIIDGLLTESESNNLTHERRALAMSLIYQLCEIELPSNVLEKVVLHPRIVSKLFIQTLQPYSKNKIKHATQNHTLKPLAMHILQHIVVTLRSGDNNVERRMSAIRSFLLTNPSFDTITQTNTISSLLGIQNENSGHEIKEESQTDVALWEKYLSFLQWQILEKSTHQDESHEAVKFIDLLFNFSKYIFRHSTDDLRHKCFSQASHTFMIGAFFDLESLNPDAEKLQNDAKIAKSLYERMKQVKSEFFLPHNLRVVLSSRFFSLVSDYVATDEKAKLKHLKTSLVIAELSQIYGIIRSFEDCGARLLNEGELLSYQGKDITAFKFSEKISGIVRELIATDQKVDDDAKSFSFSTLLSLILSLGIHMLHPGHPSSELSMNEMSNPESNEADEVFDELCETIGDLSSLAEKFNQIASSDSSQDGEEDDVLSDLVTICINILNSCVGGGNLVDYAHFGGGPRIVRDCVQSVWTSMLVYYTKEPKTFDSGNEFLGMLLESICLPDAFSDPMESDDSNSSSLEEDEIMDGTSTDDENDTSAFTKVNAAGVDLDDEDIEDDSSDADEMNADVELDPLSLENMLLEDIDENGSDDENMLEHHEGADKALAQLIKIKQEARKSGRSKKEKMDMANRLRCLPLLEAVFGSNMRKILTNQMKLMVILPLLRSRTILIKSLESIHNASLTNQSVNSEKRALVKKITSFLDSKICKGSLGKEKSNYDSCETLMKQIMIEMKSISNKEHSSLCSSLLVLVIKAAGGGDHEISRKLANDIYVDGVREWSQKRNTKIQSVLFDTLLTKYQCIAPSVLVDEMVSASQEARSPFLKSESFRLLAALFQILNNESCESASDPEKLCNNCSESILKAMNDNDLVKAKRIRDVLTCLEAFLTYCKSCKQSSNTNILKSVQLLIVPLEKLHDSSSSQSIKSISNKLLERIRKEFREEDIEKATVVNSKNTKAKKKKKKKQKK